MTVRVGSGNVLLTRQSPTSKGSGRSKGERGGGGTGSSPAVWLRSSGKSKTGGGGVKVPCSAATAAAATKGSAEEMAPHTLWLLWNDAAVGGVFSPLFDHIGGADWVGV